MDARDADPSVGWAGPGPADFAALLHVPPDRARSLVCAAVRETFEESGVLLAGPSEGELVGDSATLAGDRHALRPGLHLVQRGARPPGPDPPYRPAHPVGPLDHARSLAAALRRLVLRRGPAARADGYGGPGEGFGEHADPAESESGTWLRPAAALEAARAARSRCCRRPR